MATTPNERTFFPTQRPNLWTQYSTAVPGEEDVRPITLGTYQYGVMTRLDEHGIVFKRNRSTGVTTTFQLSTISGNPMGMPFSGQALNLVSGENTHWSLAICRTWDGYLWVVGNTHSLPQRLVRSANPDDITSWIVPTYQFGISGQNDHTYNVFAPRANGDVLWFLDQGDSTSDDRGRDILGYVYKYGASAWTPIFPADNGEFMSTRTAAEGNPNDGTEANRAYILGVVEVNGIVHFAGIWRTNDTDADSAKFPIAATSSDLITWYNSYNSGINTTSKFTWSNSSFFRITSAPVFSRTQGGGIAADANSNPQVALQDQATGVYERHYIDTVTGWTKATITAPGSTNCPPPISVVGNNGVITIFTLVTSGVPRRPRFRNVDTGLTIFIGDILPNAANHTPDPVALMAGIVETICPDGDTPTIYQYAPDSIIKYA